MRVHTRQRGTFASTAGHLLRSSCDSVTVVLEDRVFVSGSRQAVWVGPGSGSSEDGFRHLHFKYIWTIVVGWWWWWRLWQVVMLCFGGCAVLMSGLTGCQYCDLNSLLWVSIDSDYFYNNIINCILWPYLILLLYFYVVYLILFIIILYIIYIYIYIYYIIYMYDMYIYIYNTYIYTYIICICNDI